jgi:hypothetical protein
LNQVKEHTQKEIIDIPVFIIIFPTVAQRKQHQKDDAASLIASIRTYAFALDANLRLKQFGG